MKCVESNRSFSGVSGAQSSDRFDIRGERLLRMNS